MRGIVPTLPRNAVAAEARSTCGRRVHIYLPPPPLPSESAPHDLRAAVDRRSPVPATQEAECGTGSDPVMKAEDDMSAAPAFSAGVAAYPSPKERYSSPGEHAPCSPHVGTDAQDVLKREERADATLYRPLSPPMSDLAAPPEDAEPRIAVDVGGIRAGYPSARADRRKVCIALVSYEAGRAYCTLIPSSDDAQAAKCGTCWGLRAVGRCSKTSAKLRLLTTRFVLWFGRASVMRFEECWVESGER